jgi:hypothetical protein
MADRSEKSLRIPERDDDGPNRAGMDRNEKPDPDMHIEASIIASGASSNPNGIRSHGSAHEKTEMGSKEVAATRFAPACTDCLST